MIPILLEREIRILTQGTVGIRGVLAWPESRLYAVKEEVSLWSPAQQVHHSALVIQGVLELVRKLYVDEDPEILRQGGPNRAGLAVLTFGRIPRGKAKTPSPFISPPEVTRADVEAILAPLGKTLEETRERSKYLYDLTGRWPHPALGAFTAPQWIRFCRLHTEHHLRIVADIGRAIERRH
jgi:hypothetical protein